MRSWPMFTNCLHHSTQPILIFFQARVFHLERFQEATGLHSFAFLDAQMAVLSSSFSEFIALWIYIFAFLGSSSSASSAALLGQLRWAAYQRFFFWLLKSVAHWEAPQKHTSTPDLIGTQARQNYQLHHTVLALHSVVCHTVSFCEFLLL